MFDGLLKSKFYSKCKSDLKLTRTRIDMIKKKINAVQKYLRSDVADLLKNGFDINAYDRVEGLIAELNRSSCYDFLDQCCEHISKNLTAMDKQRECPEECREAAASLIFAAARFADLPELRELRTIFSERYGNTLDFYVNKQFSENLKSGHPPNDMKLQLLQDIAAESGFDWDSKALENKLFNVSAYNEKFAKETEVSEFDKHNNMDGSTQKKDEHQYARQFDRERKKDISYNEPKEPMRNEYRFPRKNRSAAPQRDHIVPPLPERHDEVVPPVKDIQVDTIARTEKPKELTNITNSSVEEHEDKPLKFRSIPPPYTKSEVNKPKETVETTEPTDAEDDHIQSDKPKPRSVRRRNPKPPPGREVASSSEGDEVPRLKEVSKAKAAAAQGQRILKFFDRGNREGRDKEERVIDKHLQHYSRKKKGLSADENSKPDPVRKSRDLRNRSSSLPGEWTTPTETPKRHTRTASLQPELLNGNAHVHPKMPDYDDFVARLAALRDCT